MNILKKIAPFISTGLGLVGGPYASMAKAILAPVLGVKPEAPAEEYSDALQKATPELIAQIKNSEQQFQLQLKQFDINSTEEMVKSHNEEMANARDREVQLARAGARDWMPMILGIGAGLAMLASFILLAFHQPPPGMKEVVILLVGAFSRDAASVYQYYFGSSKGSDDKTKVIADIAKS